MCVHLSEFSNIKHMHSVSTCSRIYQQHPSLSRAPFHQIRSLGWTQLYITVYHLLRTLVGSPLLKFCLEFACLLFMSKTDLMFLSSEHNCWFQGQGFQSHRLLSGATQLPSLLSSGSVHVRLVLSVLKLFIKT